MLAMPTEQHEATFRWRLLPQLRKLASDFISHPLSRGISECEEAGESNARGAAMTLKDYAARATPSSVHTPEPCAASKNLRIKLPR